MSQPTLPLGQNSDYPRVYDPNVLYPISRADSRGQFAAGVLPFHGCDFWTAWELTWLNRSGLPQVATVEIRVPANTPNLIESKSLKLYLNSFAMTPFDGAQEVSESICTDLSECADGPVTVQIQLLVETNAQTFSRFPGACLDSLAVSCDAYAVDAGLLSADSKMLLEESLHSHLLRSLCPVTSQPDIGSVAIHYHGPKIDQPSLLRYLVSFREHNDFHEACVESIFADILERCRPTKLSVYARFQRRGGLDINPFRSNFEEDPNNIRLWRQ